MKLRFFKLAQTLSKKSKSYPQVGCVIVKKNKVVGLGFNDRSKTHPRAKNIGQKLHAELHALIGVPIEDLKGSSVYVFREYADGSLAMAKPCSACHAALVVAGVKKVFYTTYGGYDEYEIKCT
jgi:deoxycytidylate deaminase